MYLRNVIYIARSNLKLKICLKGIESEVRDINLDMVSDKVTEDRLPPTSLPIRLGEPQSMYRIGKEMLHATNLARSHS